MSPNAVKDCLLHFHFLSKRCAPKNMTPSMIGDADDWAEPGQQSPRLLHRLHPCVGSDERGLRVARGRARQQHFRRGRGRRQRGWRQRHASGRRRKQHGLDCERTALSVRADRGGPASTSCHYRSFAGELWMQDLSAGKTSRVFHCEFSPSSDGR